MKSKKFEVLYVDDERDNLDVFQATFWRDYNLTLVSSAKEAIEILKNKEIHVIITDQRMPEMTGVEFLEEIVDEYPNTQRIILTGYTDYDTIVGAINKGKIFHYITKPWNETDIKVVIDNALELFKLKEENKKLLNKLQKANDSLKASNDELESKNIELNVLNKFKNKLLSFLTHDLRIPVANLSAILHLEAKALGINPEEVFKSIKDKTESILDFINNILIWANSQTDGFTLKFKKVNILNALNEELKRLQPILEKKNIDINLVVNPELNVTVDEQMFKTVFRNIVYNATKYSFDGGKITISTSIKDQTLKLSVTDQGKGMDTKTHSSLFKKLVNSSPGTNSETGTGLGLMMSNDLIEMHHGSIDVKSELNKGTTMTLNWPMPQSN